MAAESRSEATREVHKRQEQLENQTMADLGFNQMFHQCPELDRLIYGEHIVRVKGQISDTQGGNLGKEENLDVYLKQLQKVSICSSFLSSCKI